MSGLYLNWSGRMQTWPRIIISSGLQSLHLCACTLRTKWASVVHRCAHSDGTVVAPLCNERSTRVREISSTLVRLTRCDKFARTRKNQFVLQCGIRWVSGQQMMSSFFVNAYRLAILGTILFEECFGSCMQWDSMSTYIHSNRFKTSQSVKHFFLRQ